ncbi:MAG: ATP synthase F1 subunit gamma [Bacteroidetes bacterium]|nr:ATP synthase F1 subunit gamma [Bacteroidota bacterium]
MATLRDIKRRIKGVQSTQQITKAMKMVAAAKLRRAQDKIINARPYAREIFVMLSHLVTEFDISTNPYLKPREIKNCAVVVVTADRGLCGAFNSNIIKEAVRYINEELLPNNINANVICIGKKGTDFFTKRDFNIGYKKSGLFSSLRFESALEISNFLINNYLSGEFDKVVIIYNEFKSIIQQKIVLEQFLPIPINKKSEKEKQLIPNYIFEPNQQSIFNYLLPKHLKAQMWRILLESNAAEFGAQMTAMDNATTNAKELIRTLQLKYNKERQAAITKEILEIVSGANALKGD